MWMKIIWTKKVTTMAKKEWKALLDKANENLKKYDVQLLVDGCDENGYSLDIKWTGKLVMTEEYACGYYEHELADLINEAWAHVLAKVNDPNLARPVAVPVEKFKCAVVFGTSAVHRYDEQDFEGLHEAVRSGDGSVCIREFDTEAERKAFIEGIEAGDGWYAYMEVDQTDIENVSFADV